VRICSVPFGGGEVRWIPAGRDDIVGGC
jgi:hypothetical protein